MDHTIKDGPVGLANPFRLAPTGQPGSAADLISAEGCNTHSAQHTLAAAIGTWLNGQAKVYDIECEWSPVPW